MGTDAYFRKWEWGRSRAGYAVAVGESRTPEFTSTLDPEGVAGRKGTSPYT